MTTSTDVVPIRVLIADDHGLVRAGLRSLLGLQPDMQVVGEAADGSQALQLAQQLQPDVVLADISMPPPDGIELARLLRSWGTCCRTLIVSMHEDLRMVQDALDAGAVGYIIKRAVGTELIVAVRSVARGQRYLHKDLEARWQPAASPSPNPAGVAASEPELALPAASHLTRSESRLLQLIAGGATMQHAATALGIDPQEAQRLRRGLTGRLGLQSRTDIVRFVEGLRSEDG